MIMEKAYWLGRERASLNLARDAVGSEARLAHLDLAGRYSIRVNEQYRVTFRWEIGHAYEVRVEDDH
jgi:hypothetical protein